MTDTVFLSGSIAIKRLNEAMRARIASAVEKRLHIVIGDADGADKAMQQYLSEARYPDVEVFCVGDCRNNLGQWPVHQVPADPSLKGRKLYAKKDKAMAVEADYGLVLWDGKSPGTFGNVLELVEAGKPVVVHFAPEKQFHTVKRVDDVRELLSRCSKADYRALNEKVPVERRLSTMRDSSQGSLTF